MVVESVRVHMLSSNHVVILKEADRERYLPIWIGPWEANAIAMKLQGLAAERPLTHDLFARTLDELGVIVRQVIISDLSDDTFHARLFLAAGERTIEIDSRPSDALALAVRAGRQIFAEPAVLERAGVSPEMADGTDTEEEFADEGEPGSALERRPVAAATASWTRASTCSATSSTPWGRTRSRSPRAQGRGAARRRAASRHVGVRVTRSARSTHAIGVRSVHDSRSERPPDALRGIDPAPQSLLAPIWHETARGGTPERRRPVSPWRRRPSAGRAGGPGRGSPTSAGGAARSRARPGTRPDGLAPVAEPAVRG